jgi:hypothetical protein
MESLGFTSTEFTALVTACRRVLISPATSPFDLKFYLLMRLAKHAGTTAAHLAVLDEEQMMTLRDAILDRLALPAESVS